MSLAQRRARHSRKQFTRSLTGMQFSQRPRLLLSSANGQIIGGQIAPMIKTEAPKMRLVELRRPTVPYPREVSIRSRVAKWRRYINAIIRCGDQVCSCCHGPGVFA